MMPNVTKGDRMVGLVNYLAGPGRANEHTNQRVIAASDTIVSVEPGQLLNAETAIRLGHELDVPKAVFGAGKPGAKHVFHVSLSLSADEGALDDATWGKVANDFAERMGFTGADGKAPCRWVAIHHGTSKAGNDHIHLAVSMVREDGTRWSQHKDFKRAQEVCDALEKKYGLRVVRGEHAERGYHPKERERALAQGAPELDRDKLQRILRAASTASVDEAEFVRRVRASGVIIRPRFAQGGQDVVTGFSVALRPANRAEKPVWFGGGKIARDLTLPQMRKGWTFTDETTAEALAEWRAAANGERPATVGREARTPTAEEWKAVTAEVGQLYERMKSIPLSDSGLWAQVARETSGAFAAWSLRTEATPGPLADASKALSRSAQLHRFPPRVEHAPMPSAKGAGMLLMQTAMGPSTAAGHALLLAQLRNTMKAMHDMHRDAGRLQEAERVKEAAMNKLTIIRNNLGALEQQAQQTATAAVGWLDDGLTTEEQREVPPRESSREATGPHGASDTRQEPPGVTEASPPSGSDETAKDPEARGAGEGNSVDTKALPSELEKLQELVALSFPDAPSFGARTLPESTTTKSRTQGREQDKGRSR